VSIGHHGDSYNDNFVSGLAEPTKQTLMKMARAQFPPSQTVVVCHSEPGAWYPPKYDTALCPPPPHYDGSLVTVGRTMFETDRLPDGWKERLNKMDHVWVPTKFHLDIFAAGGVVQSKLAVVPEAVEVDFFSPAAVSAPLNFLSISAMKTLGSSNMALAEKSTAANKAIFKFLSIFKWEERKGWRVLLKAYLTEFSQEDKVGLFILTNAYHSGDDFQRQIQAYIDTLALPQTKLNSIPPVYLLPTGIPTHKMAALYAGADCFVLPSRGEGWGRPHVEAMSMALPVIATHWSGPEEYLTESNGYPLRIGGLVPMNNSNFPGHYWADPSVPHLQQLMREVVTHPAQARSKGAKARQDMVEKYCPQCVMRLVLQALAKYQTKEKKPR